MDKRIGAQLFTVRDFCGSAEAFDETIKKLHEIGYKCVQISGIAEIPAKDLRASLDKYDMHPCCTHRNWADYDERLEEAIQFHKDMGINIAGIGSLPLPDGKQWEPITDWSLVQKTAERLNEIATEFNKHGIEFGYHNHALDFQKDENGKFLIEYLMDMPNLKFIVDLYWVAYAGIDPAKFIKKLGDRAIVVHYKDLKMVANESEMCEIGKGNLDWDEITKACEDAGVKWAVVEQDTCKTDPFECLKTSYDYLSERGFI